METESSPYLLDDKKGFYKSLLTLALPIIVQNLITSSLNMVDNVMISSLGETALSAVGIANQMTFILTLAVFGCLGGGGVFLSQYWGVKDVPRIRRMLGWLLCLSLLLGSTFFLGARGLHGPFFRLFTQDPKVAQLGIQYLLIACFCYPIMGLTFALNIASRSVHKAHIPMMAAVVGLGCNTGLNYLLIYGHGGFPQMGVEGAAIATVIARSIELLLMVFMIYKSKEHPLAGSLKEFWGFDKSLIKSYFQVALPVIINEFLWGIGAVVYYFNYSTAGTTALAAIQVATVVNNIFMVFAMGVGNACSVMIGNKLGDNQRDLAIRYSRRFLKLTLLVGGGIGLGMFFSIPLIAKLFSITSGDLYDEVRGILSIKALYSPFVMMTGIVLLGILRSGGDTKYGLITEITAMWGIGIPVTFIAARFFHWPVIVLVALTGLEQVGVLSLGLPRVFSNKWAKNMIQ